VASIALLLQLPDYYAVLDLESDAPTAAIRASYRQLARLYDPGLERDSLKEPIMILLNQAHEVLTVPWKRRLYDLFPHQAGPWGIEPIGPPATTRVPTGAKLILVGVGLLYLLSVLALRWNIVVSMLSVGFGMLAAMTVLVNILAPDFDPDPLEDVEDGA